MTLLTTNDFINGTTVAYVCLEELDNGIL